MNTQNPIYRTCVFWIAIALPLTVYGDNGNLPAQTAFSSPTEQALPYSGTIPDSRNRLTAVATCSAYIPSDAIPEDSFKICQSSHSGENEVYACQTFTTVNGRYRVLFKGGRHPRAITRINEKGDTSQILWLDTKQTNQPVCDFPPPIEVPAETTFIGAGVCIDETGQPVPCSVFRHNGARTKTVYDYLIYYKPDGTGPDYTTLVYVGENRNAMSAELAYQIGLGLLKTRCCRQSGLEYIKHAYELFPNSTAYRTSYLYFKQQLPVDVKRDQVVATEGEMK